MSCTNPGNPPWPTTDGRGDWLSDESNPQAAVTDGSWVYLAAPGSEKGWAILAVDERGQKQWSVRWAVYPRCISLALEGDYLYALVSGPQLTDDSRVYKGGDNAIGRALLLCLDKRTGQYARFSAQAGGAVKPATWPYRHQQSKLWDLIRENNFRPSTYAGQLRYCDAEVGETTNALGIAAAGGRLYLSLFYEDKLLVLDAETAEKIEEIPVLAPVGLQALPSGKLLAVSGEQVVEVDPATQAVRPVITENLEAPFAVTTGPGGDIYVSDWGSSFQVKVFSAEGQLVRTIGKSGGRPWVGAYDPGGLLLPRGIAVTDEGKLWVAEDDGSPRRVSVWDARSGEFLREYLGPAIYGGGGILLDREHPETVYALGTQFHLDFKQKTYSPVATVFRRTSRDRPYSLNGSNGLSRVLDQPVRHYQGREYVISENRHHGLTILMRRGEEFVPVAAVGVLSRPSYRNDDGTSQLVWDSDLGYHVLPGWWPEFFRDKIGQDYTWSDLNADGLVQAEEMIWRDTLTRGQDQDPAQVMEWYVPWSDGLGPDWSIYVGGFCRNATTVYRLDVQGWTEAGVPLYDPHTAKLIIQRPLLNTRNTAGYVNAIHVSQDNELFVSYNVSRRALGDFAPKGTVGLACYDREGNLKWQLPAPSDQSAKALWGNGFCGEVTVPGIGSIIGLWNWWHNYRGYLLTADGLYVAGLLNTETRIGPEAAWSESYNVVYQTSDGQVYFINGANDAHHLFRLRGLDQGGRFSARLELTPAEVARAVEFRQQPPPEEKHQPLIRVAQHRREVVVDGNLGEWNLDYGVTLQESPAQRARVALQHDRENLYLAYQVQDDTPLLNRGEDWQRLFITGDCVDLMLATDPYADLYRREAAPGDLRLLLGVFQDEPIAVLYRPAVPGTEEPTVFMTTRIDQVRRLASAQVAYQRGAGSYTLEARVPLSELGLAELPPALRGDVGVIFSDESGRDRVLRLYYYNQDTAMVSDLSTEARLQPDQWGAIELEGAAGPNLLKNPGFEEGFAEDRKDGWFIMDQRNGAEAVITPDECYSGRQCLLLRQTEKPRVDRDKALTLEWSDFVKSVNGGEGGGFILVQQDVPVTPGKHYSLRLHYRTEGGLFENRRREENRGYAAFQVWLFWYGPPPGPEQKHIWVINRRSEAPEWTLLENARTSGEQTLGASYVAPAGATYVGIRLQMPVASARVPRVWVDDVEFLELD